MTKDMTTFRIKSDLLNRLRYIASYYSIKGDKMTTTELIHSILEPAIEELEKKVSEEFSENERRNI